MKLLFLGTAAAEGFPGIFCHCDTCQKARQRGGRNIRLRSALLVNDDLLLDCGPDLLASAQKFNLDLSKVTTQLLTHAHPDHFAIFNFEMRHHWFTSNTEPATMQFYGPIDAVDKLLQTQPDLTLWRMDAHTIKPFETWSNDGYTFTSYRAKHGGDDLKYCMFYSVDDGTHSFLYATDTGYILDESWAALQGKRFDVIILEETAGTVEGGSHMGINECQRAAARMRAEGMLKPGGRVIAHHLSHSFNPLHEELEEIFTPHNIEIAYDGMEVNL